MAQTETIQTESARPQSRVPEVTDSKSFNCKNDMWTKITNPCRFKSYNG